MTPEQRQAIEAELAEHTAYRALLAAAEQASAKVVRLGAYPLPWEEPISVRQSVALECEDGAWCAVRDAAREQARHPVPPPASADEVFMDLMRDAGATFVDVTPEGKR